MAKFPDTIAEAYSTDGQALDLGRGVHEGKIYVDAVVQIPLATTNRHGLIAGAVSSGYAA